MNWILAALTLWLTGGATALLSGSSSRWATRIGMTSAVSGAAAALVPALSVLLGGSSLDLYRPWSVPFGSFALGLDGLSAFFLVPALVLTSLGAIYGGEYLLSYRHARNLGVPWFLYNWMTAGIVMVFLSRNAILFLIGWEVMTLSAAFLVSFDDEKASVRAAGWIYLVATHIATAFLLVFFVVLGRESSSLDFAAFMNHPRTSFLSGLLFLLAVVSFGTKAGIMPFHVWLPEAHPAAPSHVSALMSGMIIKTGIYGLMRGLTFLGGFQEWWGWALIGAGLASALMGILFAMAQHDLKRLLAYSSVENIGIIFIGLGIGVLGSSRGSPVLATLGFCGALLHVLNHSMAKGMLFLNAGAVYHATGTRRLDHLGGLLKKMPWEGSLFLLGSVTLCALPPMNGFLSEFLIYLGVFRIQGVLGPEAMLPSLVLLAGLALVGGLAAVAFSKAFGATYLGQEKRALPENFHPPGWAMRVPMLILGAICLALMVGLPWIAGWTAPVVQLVSSLDSQAIHDQISMVQSYLRPLAVFSAFFSGLAGCLVFVRLGILKGRTSGVAGTWDCGYAQPSRKMQYTGSSYSQPLTGFFSILLQGRKSEERPGGFFPRSASQSTYFPDLSLEKIYRPFFAWIEGRLSRWRWIQHGRIQAYVLYISLTLLLLLTWKLG